MMMKHVSNQLQGIDADLKNSFGMLNDFQYRTLAMIELANYSSDELESKAEEIKLKHFNKASDDEDKQKKYVLDNDSEVNENSIVTITSSCKDNEELSIFRSKFPMSECLTPNIREKLLGLKRGEEVEVDIYGNTHVVQLLSIRKALEVKEEQQEQ
jgi:FKBP-type peptidyl-prolyl cis-trans isomerase (trigger factor)